MIAAVTAGQPVFASPAMAPAAATDPAMPPLSALSAQPAPRGPATSGPTTTGPTTTGPATAEPTATDPPTIPATGLPTATATATPTEPPPVSGLPDLVPPATVRPAVTLVPAVTRNCRDTGGTRLTTKLALAQNAYDAAKRIYDATLVLFNNGTRPVQDLSLALIDLGQATIALNNAKYELATCQVQAGTDDNKDCVLVSLELNRVADLLAQRQLIVAAAQRNYDAVKARVDSGSLPAVALAIPAQKLADANTMLEDAQKDEQDVHTAVNQIAERCGFMRYPDPPSNAR
jgi:hypothetical protein